MILFGVTDIGLFIVAGLLLNITPGADLLYITNRSAIQGKKAGVVAALGIGAGYGPRTGRRFWPVDDIGFLLVGVYCY